MSIARRIAAVLVLLALALPGAVVAQAPSQTQPAPAQEPGSSRPPVDLGGEDEPAGGKEDPSASSAGAKSSLPDTGSDPRLLILTGLALTLLGMGLRLRTADADVY